MKGFKNSYENEKWLFERKMRGEQETVVHREEKGFGASQIWDQILGTLLNDCGS